MEFRILGPLELLDNGRIVDVGAAKQRALLAVLLLNANRVVSTDSLIEALWGERPPATAQKALQVYVSQLRKAVGRDRLLTRSPGYELDVGSGELDLERVETLVAEGQLEKALALWRGSPLAEFAYEPFAQTEIARLEELRLTCLELRIGGDLMDGRHAALVGELEALVREHPLREQLRAQLMLALYRSGRQAEALDAYQAGRALLHDELGLEPGAELKDLQRAILEHDPALAPPQEQPAPEPISRSDDASTRATEATRREVRKTVTVLFCDVTAVGAELDPESLRRLTARGFDALLPVLERHGATVERSLGGAVAAVFGIPLVHEDDALRAARAAAEIRDRLVVLREELERQWSAWLELRAGIGTGEVVTGSDETQPYAGDAVQAALRLCQSAGHGELLMDERTHRLVRDLVDVEATGEHTRLVLVRPSTTAFVSRFDSPMVGRGRERRRMHDALEQAIADRSCQLFTILGTPGVGKSRLVREFVDGVAAEVAVARGRCLPYGEGVTYWPVLEAIRDVADLDDADSASASLAKLAILLDEVEEANAVAQRLGEVIGLSDHVSSPEESFTAVRTFFEALGRRRPLVIVFDDIHWGEATFLDLVDHVAEWTHEAPLLLVCVARPELHEVRPQWGGGRLNATSVLLEPLSEAESVQLVENLSSSIELDEPTRQQIVEGAGGNPLFVEEMLALLLEDDRAEGGVLEVPPTIQALLAERLDRLSDDERAAIEAAAVEGKVFHESSVVELLDAHPSTVSQSLAALVHKELVRPARPVFSGERAFAFRHLLIRDAAYGSTPKEARAALHERHARWLERKAEERTLDLAEILGYHLEQAVLYLHELGSPKDTTRNLGRRAAEYLGEAGRRALLRSDATAGANLISRSVALLPPEDPFRVELVPNVRVVQGLPDLSWADRVLTEAVEAAAMSGDRVLAAHALVQRGFLRLFTGSGATPSELFDVSDRAIAVFDSVGDELGLARAWRLVAQAHYLDRSAASCAEASEEALKHARLARDRFEVREIVEWLVIALLLGPAPAAEAFARCEELLEEEWDDPLLPAEISGAAAALVAMQGRAAEAETLVTGAQTAMTSAGEWIWAVTLWYSFISVWHGDPNAAEDELRPAYEALGRTGATSHFSSIAHALANALYMQRRYDEAEQLTEECERATRPNDIHSQTLWRSIRAKIFARRGEFQEAERLARDAVEFAAEGDFLPAHADAAADLAEVFELAGKPKEALHALEEAIALYERKENLLAAEGCRARLAAIAGGG